MFLKDLFLKFSMAFHNKWNRRYVISLMLCALIPMCVIISLYISKIHQELQAAALAPGQRSIALLQDRNESMWDTISSITVTLNNHPTILKYVQSAGDDLLLAKDAQKVLGSILTTNTMIDDIFLYEEGEQMICSSKILSSQGNRNTSPLINGEPFSEAFKEIPLNTVGIAGYQDSRVGTPYDVLFFSCKGFYKAADSHTFRILFSVRLNTLVGDVVSDDENHLTGAFLINRSGDVVGLSGQDSETLRAMLPSISIGKEGGHTDLRTEAGNFTLFYEKETYSLYRIFLLSSCTSIFFLSSGALLRLVCVFFSVAISMVALIVLVHFYNYSPLKSLEDSCRELQYSIQKSMPIQIFGEQSPYDIINETLQVLQSQNVRFKSMLEDNQEIVRNEVLLSLMGIGNTHPGGEQRFVDCGITFPHEAFVIFYTKANVAVAHMKDDSNSYFSEQGFCCYTVNGGDCFLFLLNLPKDKMENIAFYMNDFQSQMLEKYDTQLVVGFSSAVCQSSELSALYLKAKLAFEYHFLLGNALISYSDIRQNLTEGISRVEYDQKCQLLADAIREKDLTAVNVRLEQLYRLISDNGSALTCRHLCYDLTFYVVHVLNSCHETKYELNYDEFLQIETIDGLFEQINMLCVSTLTENLIDDPRPSIETINEDIAKDYGNPLFSIGMLAEHYHMSASAFSQYYKKKTGITISKYLMQYRFDQAIKLLTGSDMQIDQIVRNIGYFSTSSFIKKFKEQYGQTPMEYRISHKEKSE